MEKLQQALQKARVRRGEQPYQTGGGAGTALQTTPTEEVDLWAALKEWKPIPGDLEKSRLVTAEVGKKSAAFDMLRTKILLTMRKQNWTRLAITSATPNCGKSLLACNLAMGFARNTDTRAMLLELDLREPDIAKLLHLPQTSEMAAMLQGRVPFADQALRFRENVAIAAALKPNADPASVLLNEKTQQVLEEIQTSYQPDVMLFDLPPMLHNDETRAVLKDMDCALLVARSDVSTLTQIDLCEQEIAEQTNVMGVVLNECRYTDGVTNTA